MNELTEQQQRTIYEWLRPDRFCAKYDRPSECKKFEDYSVSTFLETVKGKCDEEQAKMRSNGFVFDDLGDRWQKLAFTFYSDIAEMSMQARQLLEPPEGDN